MNTLYLPIDQQTDQLTNGHTDMTDRRADIMGRHDFTGKHSLETKRYFVRYLDYVRQIVKGYSADQQILC